MRTTAFRALSVRTALAAVAVSAGLILGATPATATTASIQPIPVTVETSTAEIPTGSRNATVIGHTDHNLTVQLDDGPIIVLALGSLATVLGPPLLPVLNIGLRVNLNLLGGLLGSLLIIL